MAGRILRHQVRAIADRQTSIEVLVNDAVLGIQHELDSPLAAGDRIALLAQFMGGR